MKRNTAHQAIHARARVYNALTQMPDTPERAFALEAFMAGYALARHGDAYHFFDIDNPRAAARGFTFHCGYAVGGALGLAEARTRLATIVVARNHAAA